MLHLSATEARARVAYAGDIASRHTLIEQFAAPRPPPRAHPTRTPLTSAKNIPAILGITDPRTPHRPTLGVLKNTGILDLADSLLQVNFFLSSDTPG